MTSQPLIRPYRPEDREALFDICVRTGFNGGDSRHVYPDPELLPSIFAAPYVEFAPELAFVVDNGTRVVGYIVGTADTISFAKKFRTSWLPALLEHYPALSGPPRNATEQMIDLMHHPERMVVPELVDYPAHLHIDLLPECQRQGHGRSLMHLFLTALRDKHIKAVHLGMSPANTAARLFYDRMGFVEVHVPDSGAVAYLGRSTTL